MMTSAEIAKTGFVVFVCLALAKKVISSVITYFTLKPIPSVGPTGIFSYFGALKIIRDGRPIIQEGYTKYSETMFKFPVMNRWMLVVTGRDMIKEMRQAPTDILSFSGAINEILQVKYTMGPELVLHDYQKDVVRGMITRNIRHKFPEMFDEIQAAIGDLMPAKDEWSQMVVLDTTKRLVCRTSSRYFLGQPICRDKEYIDLCVSFSTTVIKASRKINLFPDFLKPLVARFLVDLHNTFTLAEKHLGPLIQARLENEKNGSSPQPNDLISWLIEEAPPALRNVHDLLRRIFLINLASIHSTSTALTNTLLYLAAQPEAVESLRTEIESAITEEGWTKTATIKMEKLDSFIKESQRVVGAGLVGASRKVLKDFVFSNGFKIPAGNVIAVPQYSIHHDENYYPHPETFEPFRFAEKESAGNPIKHGIATLSPTWFMFGQGRDACPGRFFAVAEIKAILAYILLNYDLKLENDSRTPPSPSSFGMVMNPSPTAEIMYRRRLP